MSRLGKVIALLLLALWVPVTQHCVLEAAGFELASHEAEQHSHCLHECSCDNCDLVEDGAYRPSEGNVEFPLPQFDSEALQLCLIYQCLLPDLREVASAPPNLTQEKHPENWVPAWNFVRRAAPPCRAPSLA